MKVRDVIRILERNGFQFVRQNGSHRHFRGVVGGRIRTVAVSGADGRTFQGVRWMPSSASPASLADCSVRDERAPETGA